MRPPYKLNYVIAGVSVLLLASSAWSQQSCESLTALKLDHTTIKPQARFRKDR